MLYIDSALTHNSDVWESADLGMTWERTTSQASWAGRREMSAVYTGGTIVLMGGLGEDICGYICIYIYTYIYIYICIYIHLI